MQTLRLTTNRDAGARLVVAEESKRAGARLFVAEEIGRAGAQLVVHVGEESKRAGARLVVGGRNCSIRHCRTMLSGQCGR